MDWFSWLSKTGLEPRLVYEYGLSFQQNELEEDDISYFNHEFLQSMGISIAKHRLEILKLARKRPRPVSSILASIKRRLSASDSPGIFSFGLSTSSSSTTAVGSSSGAAPLIFRFGGASSAPASEINPSNSFSSGISGIFHFGGSSSAFSSSSSAPRFPVFGSAFASPSTGFAFGAQSTSFASTNAARPMVFGCSSTDASSSSAFSFTSSASNTHPVFGNASMGSGFAAPPGNNDQMNAEDSMAEDPAPSPAPVPSQTNPFVFGGQQNQVAPQSSSPFQATGSLEFNAGGSFSLGSGGGDKSGRKMVRRINRNKNWKN